MIFQKRPVIVNPDSVLPPIEAYDAFTTSYKSYAEGRGPYHRAINDIVIAWARNAASLLDVGAGDGSRTLHIAQSAGVRRIVLLEPSAGMRALCTEGAEIWPFPIEEIPDAAPSFEVITCLWNVLGHLRGTRQRLDALARLRRHLFPGGMLFLDVSHRYNAAAYGWSKTLARMLHDAIFPSEGNGDVIVSWNTEGKRIQTHGHVFTRSEIEGLFLSARLKPINRWVISYETGAHHQLPFAGHLFYQLTLG